MPLQTNLIIPYAFHHFHTSSPLCLHELPSFFIIKCNTAKISKKLKKNQEHNPKHSSPKTIQKHATSNFWTHKHTPQTNTPKTSSLVCFLLTKSSTTNSPWSSNLSHQHLIDQQENNSMLPTSTITNV
jgi:hypothetical protein